MAFPSNVNEALQDRARRVADFRARADAEGKTNTGQNVGGMQNNPPPPSNNNNYNFNSPLEFNKYGSGYNLNQNYNSNNGYNYQNNTPTNTKPKRQYNKGATKAKVDTVVAGIGGAVLGNALGKLFNKITGEKSSNSSQVAGNNAQIDIPGTLMGSLANVVNTRQYMQNFARYNNYLTSNLGLAQMASDRYMSIKERIPMSLEYYQTPTQKKEIVMYINPENLSINTAKVKQKVYTRGGIYFHHYGDDVWTMKITGTVGYAQMRGIEALEEVYFNSGALLKYQNISVSTVHTNQITSLTGGSLNGGGASIGDMLDQLKGSGKVGSYLSKVIGTATDALGYTGDGSKSLGSRIFGNKTSSGRSNANLFDAVANSALGISGSFNKMFDNNNQSEISRAAMNSVKNLMGASQMTTGSATAYKQYFNTVMDSLNSGLGSTTSSQIKSALAADMVMGLFGNAPRNDNVSAIMGQLNYGTKNFFSGILGMLTGNFPTNTSSSEHYDMPLVGTSGNYYTIGRMAATELNQLVASVQSFNQRHTIDKQKASQNWSDIEDELTDLFRPRQVIIYFDDRVYIGHFDNFNYSRKASTPLIYYDMSFTVTRQIKIDKAQQSNPSGGRATLGELLGSAVAGQVIGKMMTPKSKKQDK